VSTESPKWASKSRVVTELETQYLRVKAAVSAADLWERVLSDQDRQQLGGDMQKCYRELGTVGMWMNLRGVSQARAIADLAMNLGFANQTTYQWLLREIGEEPNVQPHLDRPSWQASTGELRWRNQVIRRVRVMSSPSNIQVILDSFEKSKWAQRIANPLRLGQQQLHQAIRSLNEGLTGIRFHAQEGGQAITWEVV